MSHVARDHVALDAGGPRHAGGRGLRVRSSASAASPWAGARRRWLWRAVATAAGMLLGGLAGFVVAFTPGFSRPGLLVLIVAASALVGGEVGARLADRSSDPGD